MHSERRGDAPASAPACAGGMPLGGRSPGRFRHRV